MNEIPNIEKTSLKKRDNGLYMSDEDINILNKYQIPFDRCSSIDELIFIIEDFLNNSYDEYPDLENLSSKISEMKYYYYTNK